MERNSIDREKGRLNKLQKIKKASLFWESKLSGEKRISKPQNSNCKFCIVVPVYGELVRRIEKQIKSLQSQAIDSSKYELIYVVNNDLISDVDTKKEVFIQNQKVLEKINTIKDISVFGIDKSSRGNEISNCNVGKARNRGIAEASKRFYENGKNAIIIQTDADSYFEDVNYLQKIQDAFERDPSIIGIAGGVTFEFDLDTEDFEKINEIKKKTQRFILLKKWGVLNKFLNGQRESISLGSEVFSGANMISKSFETAVIGGVKDIASGEDPQFGKDLKKYAEQNGEKVIGLKDEIRVITALRDSDRTPSSFKKSFDEISISTPLEIGGVFLTEELIKEYEDKVLKMDGGEELLEHMERELRYLRII